MRQLTDAARIHQFMRLLGRRARASGRVHYDFYAQALAKIERAHAKDLEDVREMALRGLIDPARLPVFFEQIVPDLYRYPAIDVKSFRSAVLRTVAALAG